MFGFWVFALIERSSLIAPSLTAQFLDSGYCWMCSDRASILFSLESSFSAVDMEKIMCFVLEKILFCKKSKKGAFFNTDSAFKRFILITRKRKQGKNVLPLKLQQFLPSI